MGIEYERASELNMIEPGRYIHFDTFLFNYCTFLFYIFFIYLFI